MVLFFFYVCIIASSILYPMDASLRMGSFAELSVYTVALRNELCYNVRASVVPVILVEVPEGLLELAGLDEYHLQNLRRDGFRRTGVLVGTMCFRHCFVPFAHPGS